jgi:hypothetical protein
MNTLEERIFTSIRLSLVLAVLSVLLTATPARAQCKEVISGLRLPLGTALSNQGNLLVSESGTAATQSGRISILDVSGNRRTLVDGLPSAINDVGDPSGPAGLFMRGRILYVAIGTGDVGRAGPIPGTDIPNPAGPSSPIFSSILAIQFSANTEKTTTGFTLKFADQQVLANGETVTLLNGGDKIMIRMVANFADYVPFPIPSFPSNVKLSNPFQLVALEDDLYVTDGGRNLVWDVDLQTGAFSQFVSFPSIPNPAFPSVGGPTLDAVPTGIAVSNDDLLVTLFRGFPFPPGTSSVEQIDVTTGSDTPFITGLRTAIDILPIANDEDTDFLVLQHNSGTVLLPPWSGPGVVLRFETPASAPTVVTSCLTRPTTMTFDRKTATLYVSEFGGRIVAIPVVP